jgi:hypothetical protein
MPLNINNLTAGTPVTFNAQTSAQRMVFDSSTVAFRIVNNTSGIVTVLEENSDGFICQVNPGDTGSGLIQNAILVEAQYPGPVTLTPYTWVPVSSGASSNFTAPQTFTGNYTTNFPVQINAGNVSQVEGNNYYATSFATNNGWQIQGYDSGGTSTVLVCSMYNANQSPILVFNRCNGTYASKTGILNNNTLGAIQFYGMKTTTTTPRYAGGWLWQATEDWGASNHGTQAIVTTYRNSDGAVRNSFIRNDGVLEPGYGIRFGTTGLSVLSTYEEGAWTPAFTGTGVTITYTSRVGSYRRIGNYVFVNATVVFATSTATGAKVTVTGLPYTPLAGEFYTGSGMLLNASVTRGTLTTCYNNAFRISSIATIASDGEFTDINIGTCITNSYTMSINLTYKVA